MRLSAVTATALGIGILGLATPGTSLARDAAPGPTGVSLMNAAFAPVSKASPFARASAVAELPAFKPGVGPVNWTTNTVSVASHRGAVVDSVRISLGAVARAPGGLPLNLDRADIDDRAYEVEVVRDWPGAVRFAAGSYDVDVTPHAGLGVSDRGGTAEAGATVVLGQGRDQAVARRLGEMGVRDGADFGQTGRWYLFAAASGRAVGLNVMRADDGWNRAGWSTDPSSTLIGDAQLGVGWRKGPMQTSLGLIHREVKGDHMIWGQEAKDDSLVAFSLSVKPRR